MNALISLIINLYLTTVFVSSGIQIFKNYMSDKKLQKDGYKIISDNTLMENISDFICDYSYIFLPITNIKKSFKLLLTSDRKYTKKRLEELTRDNRIKKVNMNNGEKIQQLSEVKEQKIVKEETKKPEVIHIKEEKSYDITKPFKDEIRISDDIYFLEEIKKEYRKKSTELRNQYQIVLSKYNSNTNQETRKMLKKEMSTIVKKVKIYDEIFISARDRISELKRQNSKKQIK